MMSQSGTQIITIHILPNTSRIKGNQTMKLGQLVECKYKEKYFSRSILLTDQISLSDFLN